MKGLILCGGKGTRLRPYSYSQPKHLLPIANQPVIQYAIDKMKKAGIREIGIVVPPHFRPHFESVLGDGHVELSLNYIEQKEAKGLADAVRAARSFIQDDPFLLFLGDNFYDGELEGLVQRFYVEKPESLLVVSRVSNPQQFGVVQFEGNQIIRLVEKPQNPPSSFAIVGVYLFTSTIFSMIDRLTPSSRGEYELTDAIQHLIDREYKVTFMITNDWWKDTGQPKDLLSCNRRVLQQLHEQIYENQVNIESSSIEGPVVIGKDTQVIDSVIRGPVKIGNGVKIIRSYIGPYTSISNDVLIEESEIENSIVLDRAHIMNIPQRIDESIIGTEVIMQGVHILALCK
ncbi:glucose-1-phosphate thymidylyltransferase [Collibacillus ludicampi]|uniref:Glucose-1-phosphate thymidylyltransferase n=1 Tax=Collibacillus ludicampi TaxID=2771369 RepID=A0AAV4LHB1_9BACL|nr:glucose-1-phosphate thymidylyltransferase [Collibacillus ludicampi]GIM47103.1 glucose-1-phosphate thymidylyltransferase [Collibacillus ludicampi]